MQIFYVLTLLELKLVEIYLAEYIKFIWHKGPEAQFIVALKHIYVNNIVSTKDSNIRVYFEYT